MQLDFDNDLATANRPLRLFNAGDQQGNLSNAVQAAYTDKNQQRSGDQTLNVNEAVLFSRGSRTYVAVNDEQASFAANRDLIANLTGITLNTGELKAGTIAVARYFV